MKKLIPLLLVLLGPTSLQAFDFEKLFSPGVLIAGHAEYEGQCEKCHSRLKDVTQDQLCLDCHEKVNEDVKSSKGYHGKSKQVKTSECRTCHTDHKGLKAIIIRLDTDRFDHDFTDYPLEGKHRQAKCDSCHKPEKLYREAPAKCIDCHKEDDVHKGDLGEKCGSCHSPKGWSSEQFDHDKTDFKLRGTHEKVACDLCHIENKYKDTPKKCSSCHAIKDVHQNRFGSECGDCHTEKKWDEVKFDHDQDTKFRLKGKHSKVGCNQCHASNYHSQRKRAKSKTNRSCYSCHKLDDVHKERNGKKCQECHNENSWLEAKFDHDKETKFPLRGAHKKASCQSCHQSDQQGKKTDRDCYSCHKHDDAHNGEEGKLCDDCHNDRSWWMEDVRFDHELTSFPLIGQHAVVGCESCHLSSQFKDAKVDCYSCHKADDVHKQALGTDCERCHNPNDWFIWSFDHDSTDFKLVGAHEEVHCHTCHHQPMREGVEQALQQCADCHLIDDIHSGNFGTDCGKCHSEEDFKQVEMDKIYK